MNWLQDINIIQCTTYSLQLYLSDSIFLSTDDDVDDFSLNVTRYKPEELEKLSKTTKFAKKEIQLIYRGFKQVKI